MATSRARTPTVLAAYVLHHYDWSETSLILDMFTRELGRVAVAAKGAKRPYSQLRAVLLPFQRLQISLGRLPKAADGGENIPEVQTLRHAEWAGGPPMPSGAALFSGFYVNELVMKLTARGDPHPALFDIYADTVQRLGGDDGIDQAALRAFELSLLKQMGVLPDLSVQTQTQLPVDPQARYGLTGDGGVGPSRADHEPDVDGAILIGLQAALEHGSLDALRQACNAPRIGLRGALRSLLHYHLGSPQLRTRRVMQEVQSLQQLPTPNRSRAAAPPR